MAYTNAETKLKFTIIAPTATIACSLVINSFSSKSSDVSPTVALVMPNYFLCIVHISKQKICTNNILYLPGTNAYNAPKLKIIIECNNGNLHFLSLDAAYALKNLYT